jgi:hypothetical protein
VVEATKALKLSNELIFENEEFYLSCTTKKNDDTLVREK